MSYLLVLWPFVKRYGLYVLGAFSIGYIILMAYNRGKQDCANEVEIKTIKEIEYRIDESNKEKVSTQKKKTEYTKARKLKPIDDNRDSCILSNDPFEVNCLKGGK